MSQRPSWIDDVDAVLRKVDLSDHPDPDGVYWAAYKAVREARKDARHQAMREAAHTAKKVVEEENLGWPLVEPPISRRIRKNLPPLEEGSS